MRKTFTMSAAQHAKLLDAMQPVPAMWIGGPPRSVQQNANDAWAALGRELGFDGMTVRGIPGGSEFEFSAEEAPITRAPQKGPADLEYESWTAAGVPEAFAPEQTMWERQLRAIVRHWNEFGPSHGFGEQMDCAETSIQAADAAGVAIPDGGQKNG